MKNERYALIDSTARSVRRDKFQLQLQADLLQRCKVERKKQCLNVFNVARKTTKQNSRPLFALSR